MKQMSISEQLTYSTVLINCKYSDGALGSGTGFIINVCEKENECIPLLITNNHVVENSIETTFQFCRANDDGDPLDTEPFNFIYNGNKWIHHPDPEVDLRCLPLGEALNQIINKGIKVFYIPLRLNLIPDETKLAELSALEEIVMIGYPIGLSDRYNHKPIIRKGSTATHPRNNYQGKKEILIDMPCYPGSSGSPVFILNEGSYSTPNGLFMGTRIYLIGVLYGGPEFTKEGTLQFSSLPSEPRVLTRIPINLGIAIKAQRILEFEKIFKDENK